MTSKPMSVLITGANRGLGLEMVKQMLETQRPLSLLFACCRDPEGPKAEGLQALAKEHPDIIKMICLDATDRSTIKKAAHQVGSMVGKSGLNLIINNAAMAIHSPFFESTPEEMHKCFDTNAVGPMVVIQEFISLLRAAAEDFGKPGMSCRKAAVINISTIFSSNEITKESYKMFTVLPYRTSKAALNMISVCASVELQKYGILCTMLHPGWVRTDMGGSEGEIDVHESVEGMLRVMNSLTEKHSGALLNWKGETVPW
ncbi:C-signal-like [Eucyclogobius newberryi]|uniref:C-signal-like n=1 Tax=Eucyclogobius newberryi TaxID=166745 RepID=UPI003B5A1D2B